MKDLELIDNYLSGSLSAPDKEKFETQLLEDQELKQHLLFIQAVKQASIELEAKRIKQILITIPFEEETKVIALWNSLKYLSIAAALILAVFAWQPFKSSDSELFVYYQNSLLEKPQLLTISTERLDKVGTNDIIPELRGKESYFEGYNTHQTRLIKEGLYLLKEKEFISAKNKLNNAGVNKSGPPELIIALSIAQLNSGNTEEAISNLEFLRFKNLPTDLTQDIKFHLAMGYLKTGNRKEAKQLLNSLTEQHGKYADLAKHILKEIRWL